MLESSISSSRAFSPLELTILPSRALPALVSGMHLLALLVLFFADLTTFQLLVCGAAVLLSWLLARRGPLVAWRGRRITGLSWYPDKKHFYLITAGGQLLEVERTLLQACVPGLIAMKLQLADRALPDWLLLTADQLDHDSWRRLQLVLELAPPHQREASGQG